MLRESTKLCRLPEEKQNCLQADEQNGNVDRSERSANSGPGDCAVYALLGLTPYSSLTFIQTVWSCLILWHQHH